MHSKLIRGLDISADVLADRLRMTAVAIVAECIGIASARALDTPA